MSDESTPLESLQQQFDRLQWDYKFLVQAHGGLKLAAQEIAVKAADYERRIEAITNRCSNLGENWRDHKWCLDQFSAINAIAKGIK